MSRPDEIASQSLVRKNQEEESRHKSIGKTALDLATTATGIGLTAKIAPFLSKYIPADLAMKGINKVSPQLGSFLKKGMEKGLNIEDGIDFIKNQFAPKEEEKKSEKAKENRNIIEKESPELHQFISDLIKKGETPTKAASKAYNDKKFMKAINN